ncbi:MAG TPA: hypothetical protein DEQ09_04200 [Bacteroidales bacterium]|nr:hypothetical protein [Bacteroidales bacterium]
MRRITFLITIAFTLANTLWSAGQDTTKIKLKKNEILKVTEDNNRTNVILGGNIFELATADENVKIRLGKHGLEIVETPEGTKLDWKKYEEEEYFDEEDDPAEKRKRDRRRFTAHWSGFEIGLNNYLTSDYSMSLSPELSFMDLNTGKSFNVNINFTQLGIGLSRHLGIVTGLGIEFNDYKFEGNNNITKDEDNVIIPYYPDPDIEFKKSKLSTVYLTMPLLLEAQIPVKSRRTVNIAAGAIGGVKIGSHNKMVYYDGGREKIKGNDDFSLSVLRYGPTIRLGYESFQIYATYYMNGLFIDDKGPELYPIQLGMAFTFGD